MHLKTKHNYGQSKKSFFWIFVVLFIQNQIFAFNYTPVEIAKILNRANAQIQELSHSAIGETDYLISGDSMFLNPDGTHYLYSYLPSRNTFLRLDHSQFHGHNFVRQLFLYKGDIYAFGGYGFWNDHAKLIKFDKRTKEWELMMVKNDFHLVGKPIMPVIIGDSIYLYGTIEHHVYSKGTTIHPKCYVLDLKKLEFSEFKSVAPNIEIQACSVGYNNQFSKYIIFGNPNSIMYIFDKSKKIMYKNASGPSLYHESNKQKIEFVDSFYRFLVGNELVTVLPDFSEDRINIESYIELYCFEESNFQEWTPINSYIEWSEFFYKYIILLLFALVMFLGYHFFSTGGIYNIKTLNQYRQLDEEINIWGYLDTLKDNSYSEQEIDLAFRIYHFSNQVRKIKRSQIINEINQLHPGKIEKIPNLKKRNEFIYKINS